MNDAAIHLVIRAAEADGREILTEFESKQILQELGIETPEIRIAVTKEKCAELARQMGFPVVMKIHSPEISHKSDAGCVKLNIGSEQEVLDNYDEIMRNAKAYAPDAELLGVTVQPMAAQGIEVIVGMSRDPIFGPTVLFGLGGIFVEVLKDTSLRVYPFEEEDAEMMIQEIRGVRLLQGYRGQKKADVEAIKQVIMKIGALSERMPEIKEIDVNPIFVYERGLCAVDARILLDFTAKKGSTADGQYERSNL